MFRFQERIWAFRKQQHDGGEDGTQAGAVGPGFVDGAADHAALDLLGRRWALRILWELRDGALGARAIRSRCDDMSAGVLYARLGELTEAGLLERDEQGRYVLSRLGTGLGDAIAPLDRWATQWAAESA